jgi:hypothetical protein
VRIARQALTVSRGNERRVAFDQAGVDGGKIFR